MGKAAFLATIIVFIGPISSKVEIGCVRAVGFDNGALSFPTLICRRYAT